MKLYIFTFILLSSVSYAQKLSVSKITEKDTLAYIRYEDDKKWIQKIESFTMTNAEKINARVNIAQNYEIANAQSDLTISYNSIIEDYIKKYTSYKWLPRTYGLLAFYEPLFESKLRQYGLPTDLKYLPIVESNLNPVAGSWAGASGLWQFMPLTGAEYGLGKSNKVNLFYDPYMATDSACRYLKFLYKMFGDWNLVLSAYNSGQGRVLDAVRRAGTKNYWVVRQYLPAETKAYAPSFHAVRFIGKLYGLYYNYLPQLKYNYNNVRETTVIRKTTFRSFAFQNNLNLDVLYFLNPHIVTEEIPANTFVYFLQN